MIFAEPQTILLCDTETTGLIPTEPGAALLEIGMLAVQVPAFREIDSWSSVVVELDRLDDPLKGCDAYVRKMHTENGLLADLQAHIDSARRVGHEHTLPRLFDVQQKAIAFYNKHASGRRVYLGGAKPDFDRAWLAHHMPTLEKKFHYRGFDTNAFFILQEYLFGGDTLKKGQKHRVLDDCRQCIKTVHDHFSLMRQAFGRLNAEQVKTIRAAIFELGQSPGAGARGAAVKLEALLGAA
jgi:oligoribonuclease (3'-5' exoribonuclease)